MWPFGWLITTGSKNDSSNVIPSAFKKSISPAIFNKLSLLISKLLVSEIGSAFISLNWNKTNNKLKDWNYITKDRKEAIMQLQIWIWSLAAVPIKCRDGQWIGYENALAASLGFPNLNPPNLPPDIIITNFIFGTFLNTTPYNM